MEKIHELEDNLFDKWRNEFSKNGDTGFCADGLYVSEIGNQEELWNAAKRKILFLMKDPNQNSDSDYRHWELEGNASSPFFILVYSWLRGLTNIDTKNEPLPITYEFNNDLPLVIVNAKKASGFESVSNELVWQYAEEYIEFLKIQVRDIYSPNIIVCGGGAGILLDVAKLIYNDVKFEKYDGNNWIYYSVDRKIVLIDSYHPSARKSYDDKYTDLILAFQEFLKENIFVI
jgi:hypothetical protein